MLVDDEGNLYNNGFVTELVLLGINVILSIHSKKEYKRMCYFLCLALLRIATRMLHVSSFFFSALRRCYGPCHVCLKMALDFLRSWTSRGSTFIKYKCALQILPNLFN